MSGPPIIVAVPVLAAVLALVLPAPALAGRRPAPPHPSRATSRRVSWSATRTGLTARLVARVGGTLRRPFTERRRRRRIDATFPDAVEMLVLAVHAGATPGQAVHDVRHVVDPVLARAFDDVAHRMQRGRGLADAIGALVEHLGPRAAGVADAIAAADRYGTPLGPVLDGLAREAREDRRRVGEAHARTLSVKLSFPLVVCTLPAFVLLAIVPAVLGALTGLPTSPVRP